MTSDKKVKFAAKEWFEGIIDDTNFLNSTDGFIDIGVGIQGSEAWILNDKGFNTANIIGFEPHQGRYNLLKNTYPGELYNLAVSAQHGKISGLSAWDFVANNPTNINSEQKNNNQYKPVEVKTICVDTIVANRNFKSACVWADVEGSEYEVVLGMLRSLMYKKISSIFLELSHNAATFQIVQLLSCLGYYPTACSGLANYEKNVITKLYIKPGEHVDVAFTRLPKVKVENYTFTIADPQRNKVK